MHSTKLMVQNTNKIRSKFENQLASPSLRKYVTFVSQISIPIRWWRTSFLLGLTLVSSKHHLLAKASTSIANAYFKTLLSPLAHCSPSSFASKNCLRWKALLSALLLRPTQLPTTLKPMLDDVEMIATSTTLWTTYMSFPTPYFKPFQVVARLLQTSSHCNKFSCLTT